MHFISCFNWFLNNKWVRNFSDNFTGTKFSIIDVANKITPFAHIILIFLAATASTAPAVSAYCTNTNPEFWLEIQKNEMLKAQNEAIEAQNEIQNEKLITQNWKLNPQNEAIKAQNELQNNEKLKALKAEDECTQNYLKYTHNAEMYSTLHPEHAKKSKNRLLIKNENIE